MTKYDKQELPKDCRHVTAMRAHEDYIHCIYGDMHFLISLKALNVYIERSIHSVQALSSDSGSVTDESKRDHRNNQYDQPGAAPGQGSSPTDNFSTTYDDVITQNRLEYEAKIKDMQNRIQELEYVSF